MRQKYTEGFKIQAVEKALNRSAKITLTKMAEQLGVSRSALQRWMTQSKQHLLENVLVNNNASAPTITTKEKRTQGVFPHHIREWKHQFMTGNILSTDTKKQVTVKELRNEINALNKDLNRKNKALAETAALLVLQKKVNAIWRNNEGSLQ